MGIFAVNHNVVSNYRELLGEKKKTGSLVIARRRMQSLKQKGEWTQQKLRIS